MTKYLYKLNQQTDYNTADDNQEIIIPAVSLITENSNVIFDNWGIKDPTLREEISTISNIQQLSKRRVRSFTNSVFTSITPQWPQYYFTNNITVGQDGMGSDNNDYSAIMNEFVEISTPIIQNNSVETNLLMGCFECIIGFGQLTDSEGVTFTVPGQYTPVTDPDEINAIDQQIAEAFATQGLTVEQFFSFAYENPAVISLNFSPQEINGLGGLGYYIISQNGNFNVEGTKRIKTRYSKDNSGNVYHQFSAVAPQVSAQYSTLVSPNCMEIKKMIGLSNFSNYTYNSNTEEWGALANPFANSSTIEKLALPNGITTMSSNLLQNTPALQEVHLHGIKYYNELAFGLSGHQNLTEVHFYNPTTDPLIYDEPIRPDLLGEKFIFGNETEWPNAPITNTRDTVNPNNLGGIKFIFHTKLNKIQTSNFALVHEDLTGDVIDTTNLPETIPFDPILGLFMCEWHLDYSLDGSASQPTVPQEPLRSSSNGSLISNVLFILQDEDYLELLQFLASIVDQDVTNCLIGRILPISVLSGDISKVDTNYYIGSVYNVTPGGENEQNHAS